MSYKIYQSFGHSRTRARQNRKVMNPEIVFWHFFLLERLLLPYILFPHRQWMIILIAYLLLWQCHHYHPFSLKSLIVSTAGTFSYVYICTRHINKDKYDGKLSRISSSQPQLRWWSRWPSDLNFGRPGDYFSRQNWDL